MNSANSEVFPWQSVYDELGVVLPELDGTPLGSYVEKYAEIAPNVSALQYFDRAISYAELNSETNKLANALVGLGVGQGDVIGLHMPNIPAYVVALAAISKIGCAGSGVSPLMTSSELAYQIEDANISILISLDNLVAQSVANIRRVPGCLKHLIYTSASQYLAADTVTIDSLTGLKCHNYAELLKASSPEFEQRQVDGDDVMMLQYTGGTTGRPKGAELTISNLLNNSVQSGVYLPWSATAAGDTEPSESLHTGFPMFHAAGLAMVIATLRFGGQFILVPDPRDLSYICKQMKAFPPTRIAAVPSLFQMLAAESAFAAVDFSLLKIANTGAAPMPGDVRESVEAIIGEGKVSDLFGMTETGPAHLCNPPGRCKTGSVGIPIPYAETRVVDLETGSREMPVGEAGEIITTGPQVMKGYLNLPEESARAMRSWRGKTWMYTGDVGYTDDEGYIYLCDRAKDMLIVGGFKVFSVEVEDKLQSLSLVAASAVVGEPDASRPGNGIVNLFVQVAPEFEGLADEQVVEAIQMFCQQEMAPYKVPKKIHVIDAIPLTAVGKIDKKKLRFELQGLC